MVALDAWIPRRTRNRLVAVQRDAKMLVARLRGRGPSPTIRRGPSPNYPPPRVTTTKVIAPEARTPSTNLTADSARIEIGGEFHDIRVGPEQSLLEAGLDASLDMPFSCAVGGCGACRVRLVSGTVEMDEPNCLTDEERAEGYILACSSRPTSPCEVRVEEE